MSSIQQSTLDDVSSQSFTQVHVHVYACTCICMYMYAHVLVQYTVQIKQCTMYVEVKKVLGSVGHCVHEIAIEPHLLCCSLCKMSSLCVCNCE